MSFCSYQGLFKSVIKMMKILNYCRLIFGKEWSKLEGNRIVLDDLKMKLVL